MSCFSMAGRVCKMPVAIPLGCASALAVPRLQRPELSCNGVPLGNRTRHTCAASQRARRRLCATQGPESTGPGSETPASKSSISTAADKQGSDASSETKGQPETEEEEVEEDPTVTIVEGIISAVFVGSLSWLFASFAGAPCQCRELQQLTAACLGTRSLLFLLRLAAASLLACYTIH